MLTYSLCKTYSVYEIYQESEEKLMKDIGNLNCKFIAFRPPREGDWFLITGSSNVFRIADGCAFPEDCPRLIVEKLPTTVKDLNYPLTLKSIYGMDEIEIPAGYNVVDFRPIRPGDTFVATTGMITTSSIVTGEFYQPRIIVRKEN